MIALAAIVLLLPCSVRLSAQGLSATRLESVISEPLVIAQRSPVGQPIRFLTGSGGSVTGLEIDPTGTTRLIRAEIRTNGQPAYTGLLIRDVGASGTEHAGLVIQSTSNGTGTGIRLGGPANGIRPTLGTGIDITGGTGLRYNALTAGNGTALEIGSTVPPRRGIEVSAAGTDHVGILSSANSTGTGIIGSARSASYGPPTPRPGTGVLGVASTNSTVAADTIIGVVGTALRGGVGGTQTTSIGCLGRADATGTSHAGTAIGVVGLATAVAPGRASAIAGLFQAPSDALALTTFGTVYLGSADDARPLALTMSTAGGLSGRNTVHMFDAAITGTLSTRTITMGSLPPIPVAHGLVNNVVIGDRSVVRIDADAATSIITGLDGERDGRLVILIVTDGVAVLAHDHPASAPEHRVLVPGGVDRQLETNESLLLWYDAEIQRWRIL